VLGQGIVQPDKMHQTVKALRPNTWAIILVRISHRSL
jgi:hypothetical protein